VAATGRKDAASASNQHCAEAGGRQWDSLEHGREWGWRVVTLTTLLALASAGHVAFAHGNVCLIFNAKGAVDRRVVLERPEFGAVKDVAVSDDGTHLALTAWSSEVKNDLLFLWNLKTDVIEQIGEPKGFHAAPSFSKDGRTVVFAHHETLGGPPGAHGMRAYAQLYSQAIAPRAPAVRLTNSDGCHMSSVALPRKQLLFTHSNCSGGKRLELLANGIERAVTTFESQTGEGSVAADEETVVAAQVVGDTLRIVDFKLSKPSSIRVLWSGPRVASHHQPVFIEAERSVLFQVGNKTFVVNRKTLQTREGDVIQ
jgi:hypothetical protein